MSSSWSIEASEGAAGPQHRRTLPDPLVRTAWIHRVAAPALVLGSGQQLSAVDLDRTRTAGVEVVVRRSGGGAVLLQPHRSLWIDLLLPAGDPLWDDDVVRAAAWVGETWSAALRVLGVQAEVHRGRLEPGRWGALVCFAGTGPGEVLVEGRKVVGLSQRRTRAGARFQCLAVPSWQPSELLDLLVLGEDERRRAAADLASAGGGTPLRLDLRELERELVAHLPS